MEALSNEWMEGTANDEEAKEWGQMVLEARLIGARKKRLQFRLVAL